MNPDSRLAFTVYFLLIHLTTISPSMSQSQSQSKAEFLEYDGRFPPAAARNPRQQHYETQLTRYLMDDYDLAVRPSFNYSEPLTVLFSLSLHHIVDVDEKNQILTTNCWLTQIWTDVHLKWNSTEFHGIQVIRLPFGRVWKPDIILYNNADSQYSSSVINTNVIVSSDGTVTWLSHGIYKSSCDIDVEYFPFDVQNCTLKWASWTYDGYQLDLQVQDTVGDTSNYHANGEFDLLSLEAVRNVKVYSCCVEPYPDITYTILMKRRPMFYVFNLIIPCLLINGIALLVFFVPCESGEKVTLGISALLSMTVFLMTIRESLPPTEKTPLIGLYYGVSICIVTFASALAVVTLNIHHQSVTGVPVPAIVRFIVLGILARIFRLHNDIAEIPCIKARAQFKKRDAISDTLEKLGSSISGMGVHLDAEGASRKCHYLDFVQRSPRFTKPIAAISSNMSMAAASMSMDEESNGAGGSGQLATNLTALTTKISHVLDKCDKRSESERQHEIAKFEWRQVARVVDRLLFWIFTILTFVATSVILFSSPYGPRLSHLLE